MTDLSSLEASVREEAAAGTKGDRIPAAYVAEVFAALRAAEAARDAALAEMEQRRQLETANRYHDEARRDLRASIARNRDLQESLAAALKERDDWKARDELNGECLMLMREHLKRVGIEASFADDAADLAAQEIERLREDTKFTKAHVMTMKVRELQAALASERARGDRMAEALRVADRWIQQHREEGDKDWACAECAPNSDMLIAGFRCAFHAAESRLAAPSPDAAKEQT